MARNTNTSRNTSTSARTYVCLKLDNDVLEKVDALAAEQDRSRSAQIRWLLLERLRMLSPPPERPEAATA